MHLQTWDITLIPKPPALKLNLSNIHFVSRKPLSYGLASVAQIQHITLETVKLSGWITNRHRHAPPPARIFCLQTISIDMNILNRPKPRRPTGDFSGILDGQSAPGHKVNV